VKTQFKEKRRKVISANHCCTRAVPTTINPIRRCYLVREAIVDRIVIQKKETKAMVVIRKCFGMKA
jgi:hypothetical protein